MFEDFEWNITSIIISIVFSAFFLGFMWKSDMWNSVSIKPKIITSLIMPIVLYFVALKMMNR